ncbi:hypothetical protein N2599_11855 [Rhizobium sullae]|uniref:Uncharacterized protein n=1 Tax=Rhizobium sullae TaxID=50338 RepID=A0ABY5XED6_RHISU|nr:hypothetical protein [Rhizobium sullae]UWU12866.1 hypothetical protein N2599_11855 [Rhizobium sullae]
MSSTPDDAEWLDEFIYDAKDLVVAETADRLDHLVAAAPVVDPINIATAHFVPARMLEGLRYQDAVLVVNPWKQLYEICRAGGVG